MNNLSNEQIHEIMAALLIVPTSKVNGVSFDKIAKGLGELLAYREAQGNPVVIVEESDYLTVAQMTGKEPRRKAVRELYEGALIVGSKLYAAPQLPAAPDGLALVPIEPTNEMRDAWFFMEDFDSEWAAMLAAAPKPE